MRKVLSAYTNLEIAGSVSTCQIGLSKIPQVNPDIVLLSVEMPDSDIIQTLLEIRKGRPGLTVLMLYTKNQNKHAARVLEALAAGANDYCAKPTCSQTETEAVEKFGKELIKKIKRYCKSPPKNERKNSPASSTIDICDNQSDSRGGESITLSKEGCHRIDILAIGVSTGGPQALEKVLPKLPADFPVPIVIVQHMPGDFTNILAKRLNSKSAIQVTEGKIGETLRPGQAWIAPGGKHMIIEPGENGFQINTHMGPPESSCRPAVDVLFRSVIHCYGSHVLATIFTGMGQDGLKGCQAIHDSGGTIFAQDEKSSVVWGMPGAVAGAGLASRVLPIENMAAEIVTRVGRHSISTPNRGNQRLIAT